MSTNEALDLERLRTDLWYREHERRGAIWGLQGLLQEYASNNDRLVRMGLAKRPFPIAGMQAGIDILTLVEAADRDFPIGPASHWTLDQLITVPISLIRDGLLAIVRNEDVPEPWKTRLETWQGPAARAPEGAYAWDWQRFVRESKDEVVFLGQLGKRLYLEIDKRMDVEPLSQISLEDVYPEQVAEHGHMLVGFAERRAKTLLNPGVSTKGEWHALTRQLLLDPAVRESLKAEIATFPADYDPWIYYIKRRRGQRTNKQLK